MPRTADGVAVSHLHLQISHRDKTGKTLRLGKKCKDEMYRMGTNAAWKAAGITGGICTEGYAEYVRMDDAARARIDALLLQSKATDHQSKAPEKLRALEEQAAERRLLENKAKEAFQFQALQADLVSVVKAALRPTMAKRKSVAYPTDSAVATFARSAGERLGGDVLDMPLGDAAVLAFWLLDREFGWADSASVQNVASGLRSYAWVRAGMDMSMTVGAFLTAEFCPPCSYSDVTPPSGGTWSSWGNWMRQLSVVCSAFGAQEMVPFRLRLWLQSESRQWQLLEERARTASARSRALLAPKPMPTNIVIDCNRQLQAHAANFIANESLPRLLRLRVAVGVVLGVGRLDMMSEWKWGENISFIFGGQFGQRHLEDIVFSAGKVGGTKHNKPLLLSARVFAATTRHDELCIDHDMASEFIFKTAMAELRPVGCTDVQSALQPATPVPIFAKSQDLQLTNQSLGFRYKGVLYNGEYLCAYPVRIPLVLYNLVSYTGGLACGVRQHAAAPSRVADAQFAWAGRCRHRNICTRHAARGRHRGESHSVYMTSIHDKHT
jgi:hypothetical protein